MKKTDCARERDCASEKDRLCEPNIFLCSKPIFLCSKYLPLHAQERGTKIRHTRPSFNFEQAVTAVNFGKSRALQSRLFGRLCREMDAGHDVLLYHSEVRWLSRGKVLQRVLELHSETCLFMKEDKPDCSFFLTWSV